MITLKTNLHDAILFALMDAKMSQKDAHYFAREIASTMDKRVRELFISFVNGHMKTITNPEVRKEFEFFKKMINRDGSEIR